MNNYCIYIHKNKINNKVYIGQTCQKPEYRWENGEGYVQCSAFYAAIQKYGWDNFEHIILFENLTQEEANKKEEELIKQYNSNNKEYGYNITAGGNNHTFNEEGKQHCREKNLRYWQDEKNKEYFSNLMKEKWKDPVQREKFLKGFQKAKEKHFQETGERSFISEEGRQRISDFRKNYIQEHGTPTQGKGHTEEAKEKIRQSKLGEKNPMYGKHHTQEQKEAVAKKLSKAVQCIETGEIFESREKAAEWCGLASGSSISACLSGKKKSGGKHPTTKEPLHWKEVNN